MQDPPKIFVKESQNSLNISTVTFSNKNFLDANSQILSDDINTSFASSINNRSNSVLRINKDQIKFKDNLNS